MKYIFTLIIFTFILIGCNSSIETNNSTLLKEVTGKKFFEYDEIIYYFYALDDSKLSELYDNRSKSNSDSLKFEVVLGKTPTAITDLNFIDNLENFGYKKSQVDNSKFKNIDEMFMEKTGTDSVSTACINIYRNILIFKKQGKTVGIAKICFGCMANEITGSKTNTENFGQDGDYEKLEKLLHK